MPAVGGDQPVAAAVRRRRHADDRLVQRLATHRAVELGVAEGEDPAVGGDQPVPPPVGVGRHADDRLVQRHGPGRAVELGVAEGEDPAVGGDQPVPAGCRRCRPSRRSACSASCRRSSRRSRPRRRRRSRRRTGDQPVGRDLGDAVGRRGRADGGRCGRPRRWAADGRPRQSQRWRSAGRDQQRRPAAIRAARAAAQRKARGAAHDGQLTVQAAPRRARHRRRGRRPTVPRGTGVVSRGGARPPGRPGRATGGR